LGYLVLLDVDRSQGKSGIKDAFSLHLIADCPFPRSQSTALALQPIIPWQLWI
jgi:hypothetical protein